MYRGLTKQPSRDPQEKPIFPDVRRGSNDTDENKLIQCSGLKVSPC